MLEAKELLEKGDLKIMFEAGNLVIKVDTKAVDFAVKVESSYVIDVLEAAIPGDQKNLATMLKAALGVA